MRTTRKSFDTVMLSEVLVALGALALSACHRSTGIAELGPLVATCPIDLSPPAATVREASPGTLRLRLVDAGDRHPVDDRVASATLQFPSGQRVTVAHPTPLQFTNLPAGRYVVRAISLGYNARVDTLDIGPNGREVQLPLTMAALDNCGSLGGVRFVEHRPWWKFW